MDESYTIEFDEMKNELMTLANTQDSTGTFIYAGFKTKTSPFKMDANGAVDCGLEVCLTCRLLNRG